MIGNNSVLWQDDSYIIKTPFNPHIPYSEGPHVIVAPKADYKNAWTDINVSTESFRLASIACVVMEELGIAPWFNIQANGNWGLLPGAEPFFHVHIYGRKQTDQWGKPVTLPEAPGTYQYEPMPEADISLLRTALEQRLGIDFS